MENETKDTYCAALYLALGFFLWRTGLLSSLKHWISPAAECNSAPRCPLVRHGFSYSDLAAGALHARFALGLLFTSTAQLAHPQLTTMAAILEFVLLLLASVFWSSALEATSGSVAAKCSSCLTLLFGARQVVIRPYSRGSSLAGNDSVLLLNMTVLKKDDWKAFLASFFKRLHTVCLWAQSSNEQSALPGFSHQTNWTSKKKSQTSHLY